MRVQGWPKDRGPSTMTARRSPPTILDFKPDPLEAVVNPKHALAWLLVALAMTATTACGSGTDDSQADSADPSGVIESDATQGSDAAGDEPEFSAAVAAADPKEARSCLEEEGFTVEVESSITEEMSQAIGLDQILVLSGSLGAGSVSYYEDEDSALVAHQAELDNQAPGTVIGRVERAVYVFSGSDNSSATRAIEGCV